MTDSKENGWFGSWLNAAKNKSTEVLEFLKNDLEEFGTVVRNEASNVVSSTGSVIEKTLKLDSPDSTASNIKRTVSSYMDQMNTVLNPSPDDSDAEAIMVIENSETVPLTKQQQAFYDLQKSEDTYLTDPDPSISQQFQCWIEMLDDQLCENRLEAHLNSSSTLKAQYLKLVPDTVTHSLFWQRYLFKKAYLEDDLVRTEAIERRKLKEVQNTSENLKWEQQDFNGEIELTEEQQIKLLEEYENETKSKQQKKKELIGENVLFSKQKSGSPMKKKLEEIDTPSSSSSTDGEWEKISEADK